jgi:hypothetical protein
VTIPRRDAGEARDRPRPQVQPERHRREVAARAAGIAPASPAEAPAAAPEHQGMISNPWVKHWTGRGEPPTGEKAAKPRARSAKPTKAASKAKPAAKPKPTPPPARPGSINAGAAPRRARAKG